MPTILPDETTNGTRGDEGCQVLMRNSVCGRPIYDAPSRLQNTEPVCLMHSNNPAKDRAAFQNEFERILRAPGAGEADFSYFRFPTADYRDRDFQAKCLFVGTAFLGTASFINAKFREPADFEEARFEQDANFLSAIFEQDANFEGATFAGVAQFGRATIRSAHFRGATFTGDADFGRATFIHSAHFESATFTRDADYSDATFTAGADFGWATFTLVCRFSSAIFKEARFTGATFTAGADFYHATFTEHADFRAAKFRGALKFEETVFRGGATREDRRKTAEIAARVVKGQAHSGLEAGPIFAAAQFEEPEKVIFYKTYLGLALFHNCDVSKVVFSDVEWLRRGPGGKNMVFDEIVSLNDEARPGIELDDIDRDLLLARQWEAGTVDLAPNRDDPNERDYRLVTELYQRLEKNYDESGDYATGGDFHCGKMEMKRFDTAIANNKLRWLKRNLGLVACYKYTSNYGESYGRPAIWLLGTVLALGLLYPLLGLRYNAAKAASGAPVLKYGSSCPDPKSYPCIGPIKLAGNGLMAALQVATFQKDLVYEPSYPWGRLLALLELPLVSILVALLLLAVQRQFKR
jgi:uncharacterized protein YjbI with pentapeptide repeats